MSLSDTKDVTIPSGYRVLKAVNLQKGMLSYVNSVARDKQKKSNLGAIVDGKLIEIFIENGAFLCAVKNTCFMVKSIKKAEPRIERSAPEIFKPDNLAESILDAFCKTDDKLSVSRTDCSAVSGHSSCQIVSHSNQKVLWSIGQYKIENGNSNNRFFDWKRLNWKDRPKWSDFFVRNLVYIRMMIFFLSFIFQTLWAK